MQKAAKWSIYLVFYSQAAIKRYKPQIIYKIETQAKNYPQLLEKIEKLSKQESFKMIINYMCTLTTI